MYTALVIAWYESQNANDKEIHASVMQKIPLDNIIQAFSQSLLRRYRRQWYSLSRTFRYRQFSSDHNGEDARLPESRSLGKSPVRGRAGEKGKSHDWRTSGSRLKRSRPSRSARAHAPRCHFGTFPDSCSFATQSP